MKIWLKRILMTLLVFFILLVSWMNVTPGYFQEEGCCGVEYVVDTESDELIPMACPLVVCVLTPLDYLKLLTASLDFYK